MEISYLNLDFKKGAILKVRFNKKILLCKKLKSGDFGSITLVILYISYKFVDYSFNYSNGNFLSIHMYVNLKRII